MIKNLFLIAFFASVSFFGQTKKVVFSEIKWWGYKIVKSGPSSHYGTVNLKSGTIILTGNEVSGGNFVMDMNSINDLDLDKYYSGTLNDHLKNGDFFETNKFPTANFKITSVKKTRDKIYNYLITGNLTVKNKTNSVSFPAKITNINGVVTLVSNKFSFDRQKFGVAYKYFMEDILVKDNVDMLIKLTAK